MLTKITGFRAFSIIWFGQLISTLGSALTGFALGVWIYEQTDSVALFTINAFIIIGVSVGVSPFAGAIVDRWNRRWIMILCDTGAGVMSLLIWILLLNDNLQIWHILTINGFNAAFSAFQWPAHSAATTMLVPKEHLGRAGGMVQIADAISNLVSPALAGVLFISIGLKFILLIDFITFLFAVTTLLLIHVPEPIRAAKDPASSGKIIPEIQFGWTYILQRKGLLYWMLYVAGMNLGLGLTTPLLMPLMLDLGNAQEVGFASSLQGIGMLIGTLLMSIWGGPKRRIYAVIGSGLWMAIAYIFIGSSQSLMMIGFSSFCFMFALAILNANSVAMWQTKVPPDIQGRVFSVRRVIGSFTFPIAALVSGPLVEKLLQPMMDTGGSLSGSFGQWIGIGDGRGTGLLFVFVGFFIFGISLFAVTSRTLLQTENDIPDAEIVEAAPLPAHN